MPIPTNPVERRRQMETHIAQCERAGLRAFRPNSWSFESDYKEWRTATLQGVGCEYTIWTLADYRNLVTVRVDGPWPHASIDWLWQPEPIDDYCTALALILRDIARDSGADLGVLGNLAFTIATGEIV